MCTPKKIASLQRIPAKNAYFFSLLSKTIFPWLYDSFCHFTILFWTGEVIAKVGFWCIFEEWS
jgi:hypothetical protein